MGNTEDAESSAFSRLNSEFKFMNKECIKSNFTYVDDKPEVNIKHKK